MGNQRVNCNMCGVDFNVPDQIKAGKFHQSGVCHKCYEKLANDGDSCFGKQYLDGRPLAQLSDGTCTHCPEYSVCVKWPKNPVAWKQLKKGDADMSDKKKEKEKKTPPPEPAAKKGAKASTASAKKTGKAATGKAADKKAGAAAAAAKEKLPFVEFAPDLKFREGTSIVVVMRTLTSKPEITLDECCEALKASGIDSDNIKARVMKGFSYMKERGLMGKKIEDDKIIFYKK